MSSEQHHEAEENDGLLRAIGERECWMAGRQNRWSAVNNADINYQSDAWCAVSRADPADFRGDSKRETRRVRNNLVEWRAEPSVSGLISLCSLYMYNTGPPSTLLPFTQLSLLFNSIVARIVQVIIVLCYIVTH